MRTVIKILTALAIAVTLLALAAIISGYLTDGYSDGRGMALVAFMLWAMIGAFGCLTFGFIGRVIDRRAGNPVSKLSTMAIAIGTLMGLAALVISVIS